MEKLEVLIKKQEHNIELLFQDNKRLKKQVATLIYADNCRHWANVGHPLERILSSREPGHLHPGRHERGASHLHGEAQPSLNSGGARPHEQAPAGEISHQQGTGRMRPVAADAAIPEGAAKVVSALAEEAFFLQLEDTASFITSTLELLDTLELKYARPPSVSELDMMDRTCSEGH